MRSDIYTHSIRIYRGGVIVGFMKIRKDYADGFDSLMKDGADFVPCFNMIDRFTPGEPDRYEYEALMHFELEEVPNEPKS